MLRKSFAALMASMLVAFSGASDTDADISIPEYNPGSFFQSKTVIIPHDDKMHRGGEDSADVNDFVIALADGVGGWASKGINPGFFSMELTAAAVGLAGLNPESTAHELVFQACNHA